MSCEKDCVRDCAKVVTVPKYVADVIESCRDCGIGDYGVLDAINSEALNVPSIDRAREWAFGLDGEGSPDMLMRAIVNGYQVEASPEEKLREYYELTSEEGYVYVNPRLLGRRQGVRDTLDILGITIEGING